jgi:hypothetical protein
MSWWHTERFEGSHRGGARAAGSAPLDLENDEELERALRRELAETVRASGVTDAEALLDILFERRGEIDWRGSASAVKTD